MNIPSKVLKELIELGHTGHECVPPSLRDESVAWWTLVCGKGPWIEAVRKLGPEEISALIQGLVLYCRASGRGIGGSVSPVIVLYQIVLEKAPHLEPALTRWVVAHRTNSYEPFGTSNDGGATTYADFVKRRMLRVQRAKANEGI